MKLVTAMPSEAPQHLDSAIARIEQLGIRPPGDTFTAGPDSITAHIHNPNTAAGDLRALASPGFAVGSVLAPSPGVCQTRAGGVGGSPNFSNSSTSKNAVTCTTRPSTTSSTCSWNG